MPIPYTDVQRREAHEIQIQIDAARVTERDLFHARRIATLGRRLASANNNARLAAERTRVDVETTERLNRHRHDGP